MAAEVLAQGGVGVTVYDAMPSAGRKFLMAGRGGLNLTHSELRPAFLARYGAATLHLAPVIDAFSPDALRAWSDALGQPTFVGSSGRVFPLAFKALPLLRAWLRRLDAQGVQLRLRHRWTGWDRAGHLSFETPDGSRAVEADATVLALGGASWPRLGSDGTWAETLGAKGVAIAPLRPANCGFTVAWSDIFRDRFEGQPVKGAAFSFGPHTVRGEAMISRTGLEGGAIYALSAELREAIVDACQATLRIAVHLSPVGVGLVQEAAIASGVSLSSLSAENLAERINAVPVIFNGTAPIARAISTAGGISFGEIDADFMIRRLPGTFAAGEMLDWEAPTGGYL